MDSDFTHALATQQTDASDLAPGAPTSVLPTTRHAAVSSCSILSLLARLLQALYVLAVPELQPLAAMGQTRQPRSLAPARCFEKNRPTYLLSPPPTTSHPSIPQELPVAPGAALPRVVTDLLGWLASNGQVLYKPNLFVPISRSSVVKNIKAMYDAGQVAPLEEAKSKEPGVVRTTCQPGTAHNFQKHVVFCLVSSC